MEEPKTQPDEQSKSCYTRWREGPCVQTLRTQDVARERARGSGEHAGVGSHARAWTHVCDGDTDR